MIRRMLVLALLLGLPLGAFSLEQSPAELIFSDLDVIQTESNLLRESFLKLQLDSIQSEEDLKRVQELWKKEKSTSTLLETQLRESENRQRFWRSTTLKLGACVIVETVIIIAMARR